MKRKFSHRLHQTKLTKNQIVSLSQKKVLKYDRHVVASVSETATNIINYLIHQANYLPARLLRVLAKAF